YLRFFFSSRRRHTRSKRDWSSDVCSSDLVSAVCAGISLGIFCVASLCSLAYHGNGGIYLGAMGLTALGISIYGFVMGLRSFSERSEERRVGEEWRCLYAPSR